MGQASSKGLEGIANQAFPLLATADLTFDHQDLTKRGYHKIYEILLRNKLLPKLRPQTEKSNEASARLRMEANVILLSSEASEGVLKLYTRAIRLAQPGSKEIALAYACRADVTFGLKEYHDSIKDFSRALAGNYSGRKSKIYETRGRCHMALSQYSQALEDFSQAKLHYHGELAFGVFDEKLMKTIDSLIKQCESKNRQSKHKQPQQPSDPIKLTHPPSSYIKCASSAVDIKFSPELGRHVVASLDIKPGDILAIERPCVSVLSPVYNGSFFCDYCKMKSYSTVPCDSCTTVVFCSGECREAGLKEYHAIECGILSTLISLSYTDPIEDVVEMKILTAFRILNVASKSGKEMDKLMTEASNSKSVTPELALVDGEHHFTALRHLATNMESRNHLELTYFAVYATCLVHLLKEGTEFFKDSGSAVLSGEAVSQSCSIGNLSQNNLIAADILFKNLMMVHTNGLLIGDIIWSKGQFPSSRTTAAAIFRFHSLFNHSCDPNVSHFTFRGDTRYTFAIQPIKKGQQLFEDYGYNYNEESIYDRQIELKKLYKFTCKCIACLNNWPPYDMLPEIPVIKRAGAKNVIKNHLSRFQGIRDKIFQGNGTDDHLKFLIQFMTMAEQNVTLPWRPYVDCEETIKYLMALKAHPEYRQKSQR